MTDLPRVPSHLYHYYEATLGPFVNLSDLPLPEAEAILARIRREGRGFASRRGEDYLIIRRELEARVRALFIEKGGRPRRKRPYTMTLGACSWLHDWYPQGRQLRLPLETFHPDIISFTYGDTFPAMRYPDGRPYRRQVYTVDELADLIDQFGLPQKWNPDGALGPDRYIEAQIWDDEPLQPFMARPISLEEQAK